MPFAIVPSPFLFFGVLFRRFGYADIFSCLHLRHCCNEGDVGGGRLPREAKIYAAMLLILFNKIEFGKMAKIWIRKNDRLSSNSNQGGAMSVLI
ncbi:MAG: hypothetical protein AAF685_08035 [Cyanobacteria bacterium P01_C01_bin.89]